MQLSIIQRTQNTHIQHQPQFPKIPCAFHPNQSLTNFCTCQCCLLPLCPSCIKIHTNQHTNILKNISPQYQPLNQLLQDIYQQVQQLIQTNQTNYNQVNQVDAKIGIFRQAITQKITNLKNNVLGQVDRYFNQLEQKVYNDIESMSYVKLMNKYKEQLKKSTIGLKNISKSFNTQNTKIMRTVIKYKGGNIKNQVQSFQNQADQFLRQVNHNFITFSIRQDYKQIMSSYLQNIHKIQISDINTTKGIPDIFKIIKQVYQKQPNNSNDNNNNSNSNNNKQAKKQIIRSLGTLLQNSSSSNNKNSMKNSVCTNNINNNNYKPKRTKHNISNHQISSLNSSYNTQINNNYLTYNDVSQNSHIKQKLQSYNSVSNQIRTMHYANNSNSNNNINSNNNSNNNNNINSNNSNNNVQNQTNKQQLSNNKTNTCNNRDQSNNKRRSLSKGKGLSLMQLNTIFVSNNINPICPNPHQKIKKGNNVGSKAVDIKQPYEFNRTTVIRKSEYEY